MTEATVLVLDRNPERQAQLRTMLEGAGFRMILARDGAEAAQALAAGGFRLLVLDPDTPDLDAEALRAALHPGSPAAPASLADAERRHIAQVLRHTHGNRRQAALLLGMARSTLLAKIRLYGLEEER